MSDAITCRNGLETLLPPGLLLHIRNEPKRIKMLFTIFEEKCKPSWVSNSMQYLRIISILSRQANSYLRVGKQAMYAHSRLSKTRPRSLAASELEALSSYSVVGKSKWPTREARPFSPFFFFPECLMLCNMGFCSVH